jgi:hypothetical protein
VVVELYVQDDIVGIISKDAAFTPQIAIPGFTTVRPGITLATSISGVNQYFQGTATNANTLGGVAAANYLQNSGNQSITGGNLSVSGNITGSYILGNGSQLTGIDATSIQNGTSNVRVVSSGGNVSIGIGGTPNIALYTTSGEFITGNISATGQVIGNTGVIGNTVTGQGFGVRIPAATSGNAILQFTNSAQNVQWASISSNTTNVMTMSANTVVTYGQLSINSANLATAIINGGAAGGGNIGASGAGFNTIYAKATTAQYADLAERFASDQVYAPGTVVELGGSAEITKVRIDASDSVLGVISTNPAYMMNGGAGDDDTHPPVALAGRVPVSVIGIVNKGDRLISAGNGLARSAHAGEATVFNVIGRALSSKTTETVGTVEAIVTIK